MLLAGDRHGLDVVEPAGSPHRILQGLPPVFGINLGALGMPRGSGADQGAGGGIPDHHFAGLGGAVHSGDQCHGGTFHRFRRNSFDTATPGPL